MNRTHYEILGVEETASPEDVKSAYRRLARTAHPDAGGNAALFGIISDAFTTLSDPSQRSEYDRLLSSGASDSADPSSPSGPSDHPSAGPSRDPRRRSESYERYRASYAAQRAAKEAPPPEEPENHIAASYRALVGAGTVVWLYLSEVVRVVLGFLGFGVEQPDWPATLGEFYRPALVFFLVGYVFVAIPWATRAAWRPFPASEQLLVGCVLAIALVFGWEGLLFLLVCLVPYLVLMRCLRKVSPSPSSSS